MKLTIMIAVVGACFLAVHTMAYNDEVMAEQMAQEKAEQHIADVCEVRGYKAVRDNDGKLVCPDSSPSWSMSRPMNFAESTAPRKSMPGGTRSGAVDPYGVAK